MSRFELGRRCAITCGLVLLLAAIGQAIAASATTIPATLPAPDAASARTARRQVQELQAMRKLDAHGLLALSLNTSSSPALRYAAAVHAMEMASDAGQVQDGLDAIGELHTRFGEDELSLGVSFVKRLAKAGHNDPAAVLGCRYMDAALTAGRRGIAADLNTTIATIRPALSEQLALFCSDAQGDFRHACELLTTRASTTAPAPAPASAPSTSAEYACLYQNRWEPSLEELARANAELSPIAREDLASTDLSSRILVAERWWRAAQQVGGRTGWRIARRACAIYEMILPQVDGVQKALVTGRLAEHQRQAMIHTGMLPGVIREMWKDGNAKRDRQQTATIDLPREVKLAGLPRTDAHVRYSGQLFIEQPGRYELTCIAGSGLRLHLDGKPLVDNPKAYSKRNGEKLVIDLAAGLHPIEIEVWSASSQPRLELQWLLPGSAQKQPIPDSALFHDPLVQ